jgi:hypothetical protein
LRNLLDPAEDTGKRPPYVGIREAQNQVATGSEPRVANVVAVLPALEVV